MEEQKIDQPQTVAQSPNPVTPPQPAPPIPNTQNKSNVKIFTVAVGIIILIIILFFGFNAFIRKQELTSPSKRLSNSNAATDLTKNWKTYSVNDDITGVGMPGLTIKYPSYAIIKDGAITLHGNYIQISNDELPSILSQTTLRLPTVNAEVYFYDNKSGTAWYSAQLSHGGYLYSFSISGKPEDVQKDEGTFKQMLSTIIFNNTKPNTNKSLWQEYKDTKNGFSILYPDGWNQKGNFFSPDKPCDTCGGSSRGMGINILNKPANTTLDLFVQDDLKKQNILDTVKIIKSPSFLPGLNSIVVYGIPGAGSPGYNAYIENGSSVINIGFESIGGNTEAAILSTFKFSDQIETGWKNYSGEGFEIQYPDSWRADTTKIFDPNTEYKGGNGGNATLYKSTLYITLSDINMPLAQYIDNSYDGNQPGFKSSLIKISGLDAESFYNPLGEGTNGWYVAFSNGKKVILFGPNETDITQNKNLNQILSTFKFTK